MRNKISCTAERLDLLDPQMIQAVSDAAAFRIGRQYLMENRVRITEADDTQVSSAVIGTSGLYEQTIRLKDGHLISACSCTLQEKPLCHHCIAALLEYHRWAKPRQSRKPRPSKEFKPLPQVDHSTNRKSSLLQSPVPDIKLHDIMKFIEWLQPAMKAVEKEEPLPDPPAFEPGEVPTWIQTIKSLEDRRRESEEVLVNLESEIRDREVYAGRLTEQLETSMTELKTAQATSQDLQHEIDAYKQAMVKLGELTTEVAQYDEQIRAAAREILQKSSHIDKLTTSLKDVAEALKAATKPTPQP
jgi:prefoldin subunit 5